MLVERCDLAILKTIIIIIIIIIRFSTFYLFLPPIPGSATAQRHAQVGPIALCGPLKWPVMTDGNLTDGKPIALTSLYRIKLDDKRRAEP